MKIRKIAIICTLASIFISCASTPKATEKPGWVDFPSRVFEDDVYISRVGSGYTKTEALADAEQELGKYFGTTVKSTVTGRESLSEDSDGNFAQDRTLDKEYVITLDVELFAVEKTKPWYDVDSELYYICAYLDREKAFDIYKPTIVEARTDFYKFFNQSGEETDLFRKIKLLKDTKIVGEKYKKVLNFAQVLLPTMTRVYSKDYDDISSVDILLQQTQAQAAVKVTVNNDYGSKINDYVSKVFADNGFGISNNKYQYEVYVDIDTNKSEDEYSGIITSTPSITISLKEKATGDIPFTYTKNFDVFKSYQEKNVDKKAFTAIETELNQSFETEFKDFLDNL